MPWFRGLVRYGDDLIRTYKVEAPDVVAAAEVVGEIARGLIEPSACRFTDDELEADDDEYDGVFPMEENNG